MRVYNVGLANRFQMSENLIFGFRLPYLDARLERVGFLLIKTGITIKITNVYRDVFAIFDMGDEK